MSNRILVQGICDTKFTPLYEAMEENLNDPEKYMDLHPEYGAAVSVYLDNRLIVDLWGGHRDPERKQPWTQDTLVNMFSVGKPLCVFPLLLLAEKGSINLEDPVVKYWPEYGQNGKEETKVWMTICMQTGLGELNVKPGDGFLTHKMIHAVEEAPAENGVGTPAWNIIYHSIPGPHLVTRVTGRTVAQFWQQEIAKRFGIDYHFGLSLADRKRLAKTVLIDTNPSMAALMNPDSNWFKSTRALPITNEYIDDERFLGCEIYSTNGCGTSRSVAKYYSILANGGEIEGQRLISQEMLEYARMVAWERESYCELPWHFSKGGYVMRDPGGRASFIDNPNCFGSTGLNESRAFADPDANIGFCFTHNIMSTGSAPSKYYQRILAGLNNSVYN